MDEDDEWEIKITGECAAGETSMANFRMDLFLRKMGIKDEYVKFEDHS